MVPDGTYTLQSKAFEATGASGYSTGVEVTVDNSACLPPSRRRAAARIEGAIEVEDRKDRFPRERTGAYVARRKINLAVGSWLIHMVCCDPIALASRHPPVIVMTSA